MSEEVKVMEECIYISCATRVKIFGKTDQTVLFQEIWVLVKVCPGGKSVFSRLA